MYFGTTAGCFFTDLPAPLSTVYEALSIKDHGLVVGFPWLPAKASFSSKAIHWNRSQMRFLEIVPDGSLASYISNKLTTYRYGS